MTHFALGKWWVLTAKVVQSVERSFWLLFFRLLEVPQRYSRSIPPIRWKVPSQKRGRKEIPFAAAMYRSDMKPTFPGCPKKLKGKECYASILGAQIKTKGSTRSYVAPPWKTSTNHSGSWCFIMPLPGLKSTAAAGRPKLGQSEDLLWAWHLWPRPGE